jgi:hypothetical protein
MMGREYRIQEFRIQNDGAGGAFLILDSDFWILRD